jgi:hypothetical protein
MINIIRDTINGICNSLFMIWTFSGGGVILAASSTVYYYEGSNISHAILTGLIFWGIYAIVALLVFRLSVITNKKTQN